MIEEGSKAFMADNYYSWSTTEAASTFFAESSTTAAWPPTKIYSTWTTNWPQVALQGNIKEGGSIREQFKDLAQKIIAEGGDKVEMRTLFKVYVVDPRKGGKILMNGEPVIAANENQAMLKVGVAKVAGDVDLDIEQVDVYVEEVATFIRPRKETGKVKIVKDEED